MLSYSVSHVLVGAEHVERHADTADYLLVLRLTFVNWGLPQQLRVDRDSVYCDNTSKWLPTRLHLFLLGLGIELAIGPAHQPRKRAITERTHQTWAWQVLEGQTFADWDALWRACSKPAVSFSITTYPAVAALTCHHSSPIRRPPCRADLTIRRVSQPCSISSAFMLTCHRVSGSVKPATSVS